MKNQSRSARLYFFSAILIIVLGLALAAHAQSGAIIGSLQPVATFAGLVSDGVGNIYGVENATAANYLSFRPDQVVGASQRL